MEVKTFRAESLHEALNRVRAELGPDAAVLQTREVRSGWLGWGRREIEVIASADVQVPSRLPPRDNASAEPFASSSTGVRRRTAAAARDAGRSSSAVGRSELTPPPLVSDYRQAFRPAERAVEQGSSMVAALCGDAHDAAISDERPARVERPPLLRVLDGTSPLPARATTQLKAYAELLEAEFPHDVARELVERALMEGFDDDDSAARQDCLARIIEPDLITTGPLRVTPGQRRIVALVGPTGVGKTTTIAKLAANYRLREHRRVGLITVDTYRIAAVEQLRTYADIIDLPLEVVSTPREMGQAVERFADIELVLIDTAGRSPHDDVRIHELRALLHETRADDILLVLSAGTNVRQLQQATAQFSVAGVTAVVLTKLDESPSLGSLFPWLRACKLPVSYLTNGQNVPQDIEPADRRKFARRLLGHDG